MPMGPTWISGSWDDDAWQDGSWGTEGQASIVGSGGVRIGGAADIETHAVARSQGGVGFALATPAFPIRRNALEARGITIVGRGGVQVGGAATIAVGTAADTFARNRAAANAFILAKEMATDQQGRVDVGLFAMLLEDQRRRAA